MKKVEFIKGFSKLSKEGKIEWLTNNYTADPEKSYEIITSYWHNNADTQKLHDEFIENTLTNYYLPFGVAPNFLINGKLICVPLAIEESSVVAAAAKAANFWYERGGFKTTIISTEKIGQVHFTYKGDGEKLRSFINEIKPLFYSDTDEITRNMRARGGGILDIQLVDKTLDEPDYYQLFATFETCDSMGANFINSCLEQFAKTLKREVEKSERFTDEEKDITIIMCILSNYTPKCLVRAEVSCKVEELEDEKKEYTWQEFVEKFTKAVRIAEIEPHRATTHNKGIFNGIDSVVIATGNDFRAVEACGHTYASRNGRYSSLTHVEVKDGIFKFWLEVPMALGTVGGLTSLHPMVKFAYEILGKPNAKELMGIVASVGLAQNFSALRSLVTTGIQKGHMKMHLLNILNQLEATEEEKKIIVKHFEHDTVSHQAVVKLFCQLRGIEQPENIQKKAH